MFSYFASLSWSRLVLWCYLCWYASMVWMYFDAAPQLWLSSVGISGLIGIALILSTTSAGRTLDRWTVFRLFLMPFCVSSYSALIKGHGFILLFSPRMAENAVCASACAAFVLWHLVCRFFAGVRTVRSVSA